MNPQQEYFGGRRVMGAVNVLEDLLYPVVDELKETAKNPGVFQKSPDTPLFGKDAAMDSLGLVNFVVAVEERILDSTGISITIVSEKAMSRSNSPFRTLGSLASYVEELILEANSSA